MKLEARSRSGSPLPSPRGGSEGATVLLRASSFRLLASGLALLAFLSRHAWGSQEAPVNYQEHLLPILQNNCLTCHNSEKKKGDLDLSTYTTALVGGGSGELATAGDPANSTLWKVVSHAAEPHMPPKKPKLPDAELAVFRKWIEGGLVDAKGGAAKKVNRPKVDLALNAAAKGRPAGPPPMPKDLLLEPVVRTPRPEALTALAASPWAPLAAVAGQHQVLLYDTDTLELAGILPFPERRVHALRFSRNGALLLAGGGRGARLGRVVVWDVRSGDRLFELGEELDIILAADISADQGQIALGGPGRLIKIYSTKDGELQHSIKKHTDWVTALEFSPDGLLLATGDRNGGLHVWEARTGSLHQTLNGHRGAITDVSWRADSGLLASSSEDGQAMLWEMQNGTRVRGWQAHPGAASIDFAKDGRLVTCGRDMITKIWTAEGSKVRDLEAFADLALHSVFTHDGARVLAGDWTGEVRAWSAADGKRLGTLTTNPPPLADRTASAEKALADARAALGPALEARKTAEASQAEAEKAFAGATRAAAAAQAEAEARKADADRKADASKGAAIALQKATEERSTETATLSEAARKARESADQAADTLKSAQKALDERQAALKQTAARRDAGAAQAAPAKAAADAASARVAALEARVALLRAARFNLTVHARKAELAKLQAEHEALLARVEFAKQEAGKGKTSMDAAVKAATAAQDRAKALEAALEQAQAGPAKAKAAHEAARRELGRREERVAASRPLADRLAEAARAEPGNATLAQAAAKAVEAVGLLGKDVLEAKALAAAREEEIAGAAAAIPAAGKALAAARARVEEADLEALMAREAAVFISKRIASEQAKADAFKAKVDAARAEVERLRAEYARMLPAK